MPTSYTSATTNARVPRHPRTPSPTRVIGMTRNLIRALGLTNEECKEEIELYKLLISARSFENV